jgi:hypothetical protein
VRQTELTDLERKLLGIVALSFALMPIIFMVGMATIWLVPSVPHWLLTVGFVLLIVYAGLLLPFLLLFEYIANEVLPENQRSYWSRRFRSSPFALWSFWRQYLR